MEPSNSTKQQSIAIAVGVACVAVLSVPLSGQELPLTIDQDDPTATTERRLFDNPAEPTKQRQLVGNTTIVAQDEANAAPQPKKRYDAEPAAAGQPVRIVHGTFVRLKDREEQSLERRELTLALEKLQEQRLALKQEERKVLQAGIRDIKRQISELEAPKKPHASGNLIQAWIVGVDHDERAIAESLKKARVHARRLKEAAPGNAPGSGFIFDNLAGRRDE